MCLLHLHSCWKKQLQISCYGDEAIHMGITSVGAAVVYMPHSYWVTEVLLLQLSSSTVSLLHVDRGINITSVLITCGRFTASKPEGVRKEPSVVHLLKSQVPQPNITLLLPPFRLRSDQQKVLMLSMRGLHRSQKASLHKQYPQVRYTCNVEEAQTNTVLAASVMPATCPAVLRCYPALKQAKVSVSQQQLCFACVVLGSISCAITTLQSGRLQWVNCFMVYLGFTSL